MLISDPLDPHAKIPEFKACAVKIEIAREEELVNEVEAVGRGRY